MKKVVVGILTGLLLTSFIGCDSRGGGSGVYQNAYLLSVEVDQYNSVVATIHLPDGYYARLRLEGQTRPLGEVFEEGDVPLGQFKAGEYVLIMTLLRLEGQEPDPIKDLDGFQETLSFNVGPVPISKFMRCERSGDKILVHVKVPQDYLGLLMVDDDNEVLAAFSFIEPQDTTVNDWPVDLETYVLETDNLLPGQHVLRYELRFVGDADDFAVKPFGHTWIDTCKVSVSSPEPPSVLLGYYDGNNVVLHVITQHEAVLRRGSFSVHLNGSATVIDQVCTEVVLNRRDRRAVQFRYQLTVFETNEVVECVVNVPTKTIPVGGEIPHPNKLYRLQRVFDDITVGGASPIDVTTDFISDDFDSYWSFVTPPVGYEDEEVTMLVEWASFRYHNRFGIYDANDPSNRIELFDGSDSPGAGVEIVFLPDGKVFVDGVERGQLSGRRFGFYLDSSYFVSGDVFFSDSALNPDGKDHMLAYQGDGSVVIDLEHRRRLWGCMQDRSSPQQVWNLDEFIIGFEDLKRNVDWDYEDMVVFVRFLKPSPCVDAGLYVLSKTPR